jgi:hypothetical protein
MLASSTMIALLQKIDGLNGSVPTYLNDSLWPDPIHQPRVLARV